MRLLLAAVPAMLFAQLCATEGIGMGSGMITVHNGDNDDYPLTVSDTPECVVGLKSHIEGDTTKTYDIAEEGAYVCIGERGGMKVENGGSYQIRGGALGAR